MNLTDIQTSSRDQRSFSVSISLKNALRAATAALVLLATSSAARAQTAANEPAQEGGLNLPDGLTMYGDTDPNVRRATAIVNGEIITGTDVDQRLALILAANQSKVSDEERARLRLQVLRNLIDETLQIQEAKANEITIEDAQVQASYDRVAEQNFKRDSKALDAYLTSIGSSPRSLKRQILGEIAWQRLLGRNIQPFVNVAEEEVNDVLARLRAAKGTEEYRLGEIYLSANPENRSEVFQNARQIIEQLKQGGSFLAYARQFSEASTAAVGGDLGWIRLAQLPPQLAATARELGVGQLAGPIEIPGGFSIIYVIDKRQILTADPRDARLSLKQLSIEFKPGSTEAEASAQAANFAQATKSIRGCGEADKIAASIGATVVNNDQVLARELPPQLQDTVLALSVGEVTPPFGSVKDGVRVLILCGRDDAQVDSGPTFDQMMTTLEDERINKRAQLYLRDLRRDAIIEYN